MQSDKNPTSSTGKEDIKEWLRSHRFTFKYDISKPELLELSRFHKPAPSHVIDQTIRSQYDEIAIFHSNGVNVINTGTDTWTVEHHGVPEHGFEGGFGPNPNEPSVQNHSFIIPKIATVLTTKGCLRLGPIGMSISGAPFYNPYNAQGKNAVEGDCQETFDDCSGHPSGNEAYHYHKLPSYLYNTARGVPLQQMFLGVAFDGYPIYGPLDDNNKIWTSGELDKCHSHTYTGRYMYRITHEFPYIMGCFHGDASLALPRGTGQNQNNRPPGRRRRQLGQRACSQVEYSDWMRETCYAFCETPSDGSFDDCTLPITVATNSTAVSYTTTISRTQAQSLGITTKRFDDPDTSSSTVIKCSTLLSIFTFVISKATSLV